MFDIAAPIRASITGRKLSRRIFSTRKLGKKVSIERLKKILINTNE